MYLRALTTESYDQMIGEGDGYKSFRVGLFGLDKLMDVDASVARFEAALDRAIAKKAS